MLHFKTFHTRSIGWALYGVNFRSLQEIETIMRGGWIFDTGPFFARLRYINCCHCCWLCDHVYVCRPLFSTTSLTLVSAAIVLKLILMEHFIVLVPVSYYKYTIHILILWYCSTWKYLALFPGLTQLSITCSWERLGTRLESAYFGIFLTVSSVGEGVAWCNLERICTSDRCLWRL